MRLYLTGAIAVETGAGLIAESRFPSRQSRLLFAVLACERSRGVPRGELAEILWRDSEPPSWESALKALVSKLRRLFAGMSSGELFGSQFGCYQLRLPPGGWVDWEAARIALDEAEGAIRSGKPREGWGPANVAVTIGRRGFLPGEGGPWVAARRRALNELLARALDGYARICLETGQPELAVQIAEEAVSRGPFRESGYQRLMGAHALLGNRAEAVRAYHRCRELLQDELGVTPSAETESVYLRVLKAPSS